MTEAGRISLPGKWFSFPSRRSFVSRKVFKSGELIVAVCEKTGLEAACEVDVSIPVKLAPSLVLIHLDSGAMLNGIQTRAILRSCGVGVPGVPKSDPFSITHCKSVSMDVSKVSDFTGNGNDGKILMAIRAAHVDHGVTYQQLISHGREFAVVRQKIWHSLHSCGVPIKSLANWFIRNVATVDHGIKVYEANELMRTKSRKWVRPVSESRMNEQRKYRKLKAEWLPGKICAFPGCSCRMNLDVHHTRGRIGRLLCEQKFWLPLCRKHHEWVGENISQAREMGLICQPGKWNTYE